LSEIFYRIGARGGRTTEAFDLGKDVPDPVTTFTASPNFREGRVVVSRATSLGLVKSFQRHLAIKYSSKRPTLNAQRPIEEDVRNTNQNQKAEAAGSLSKVPTDDGMGLVFHISPEAPAQCAVEISRALKEHPRLQLRMGVHSGPVSGVIDVNDRANVASAGLNIAQRVMDCGDAGHILLSKHVAEDLEEYEQ